MSLPLASLLLAKILRQLGPSQGQGPRPTQSLLPPWAGILNLRRTNEKHCEQSPSPASVSHSRATPPDRPCPRTEVVYMCVRAWECECMCVSVSTCAGEAETTVGGQGFLRGRSPGPFPGGSSRLKEQRHHHQTLLPSLRSSQGTNAGQMGSSSVELWQHCPYPCSQTHNSTGTAPSMVPRNRSVFKTQSGSGEVNSFLGPQTQWERGGPADPDPGCPRPPSPPALTPSHAYRAMLGNPSSA